MKIILLFPLLFALSLANREVIEIHDEDILGILKKMEGAKIDLPKELVDQLNVEMENIDERAIGITAAIDSYIDRILVYIKSFIIRSGLDPVEMPNTTLNLIPTGSITLTAGWLQDISTISRNGNSTVSYSTSTRAMEFYLPIKLSALLVTYKYHTKVLLLSIKGDANGKIEDLKINVKLSYNYGTYQVSLDKFDITDSGRFSLKFTGNGLLDWITNTMTTVVTFFMQPIVIRIVQSMIKGGLGNAVDQINDFINNIFTP